MTALDFWSPALAPAARPLDDEPPLCLSLLYTPDGGLFLGPLVCIFNAGHPVSGGPTSLHCGGSEQYPTRWTDEAAALSLAMYRASAKSTGPLCTDCNDLPQSTRGLCTSCAAFELAADNYEPESDAA